MAGLQHSTLSRRDFMKTMAVATAAFSSATAITPVFHDLDEMVSSNNGPSKAWWIKQVDKPTTDIDWNVMHRFPKQLYDNYSAHQPLDQAEKIAQDALTECRRLMSTGEKPGYTLRDQALKLATWAPNRYRMYTDVQQLDHIGPQFFPDPSQDPVDAIDAIPEPYRTMTKLNYDYFGAGPGVLPTPKDQGIPNWQGTPEENSRTLTAALKYFGASDIAFSQIDSNTTQKLLWTNNAFPPFQEFAFEDVDAPYQTSDKRVIPNKCKWVVSYVIRQSPQLTKRCPTALSDASHGLAYDNFYITQGRLQNFLTVLGYHCIGQNIMGIGPTAGWGVISGLGELGRLQHLITPTWGPLIRMSVVNIIDMPVEPTKPIDFGAKRFCHHCRKCADSCPGEAIQTSSETSWDITKAYDLVKPELFNNPGLNTWYYNHFKCRSYWMKSGTDCGVCHSVCVFSKNDAASIHALIKPVVSNTTAFDGLFTKMDQSFGYGLVEEGSNSWWDINEPTYGINTDK